MTRRDRRLGAGLAITAIGLGLIAGCSPLPIVGRIEGDGTIRADARVAARADLAGALELKLPAVPDPGPLETRVVRPAANPGQAQAQAARIALIDLDGLLLNQNLTGLYSVGENPVATFREKLERAAGDPAVAAVVLRINSPGGGVTASDIMAEELRRFRAESGKPVVASLMDLATSGAYYVALGADLVVAHPTSVTGGVGAVFNHFNLQDAMAQLNVIHEPIKAGAMIDVPSVTEPLSDEALGVLEAIVASHQRRFLDRLAARRPSIRAEALETIADGRVLAAPEALELGLIDRLGYLHDAIGEAERLAGVSASGAEVVLYHRESVPPRSVFDITPNVPLHGELVPFSYPGLDRDRMPTFLYLWQPDPAVLRLGGR